MFGQIKIQLYCKADFGLVMFLDVHPCEKDKQMIKRINIPRWWRFLNSLVIAGSCLFLVVLIVVVATGLYVQSASIPKLLGNGPKNIAHIKNTTDPNDFTFIVVGDVKGGTATFEGLLDFSQLDKPAFAVILGDFVNYPELIQHKLFAVEMVEHARNFSMFVVPGNHDINPDSPFQLKDFEEMWGPAQFQFTMGKNLFVFLNDAPPYDETGEYLKFLEQILSKQAKESENIFVFMHVPPSGLNSSIMSRRLAGSESLLDLAKKYHVNYVFAGDHHGYVKTIKDGTTFIVTGGGGARLRGIHGRFYHIVRIAVKSGMVNETVFAGKKHLETLELIERNIVIHLWPQIARNSVSVAITLLLFGVFSWLLIFSVRRRKKITHEEKHL